MAGFKLNAFGGFVPRVAAHLLQDNESQLALNTKLYSGSLRPWFAPLNTGVNVPFGTKTIHKVNKPDGSDLWFSWTNEVDVANSPLQDSEAYRIIYTGDGAPKKTNHTLAGATDSGESPADWLYLGVQAPSAAPTVARVGTGASPETRIYVYTFISEFGDILEESAPSPVSAEVLCGTGDTVTVSGFAAAPTTGYNITKRRIYRSVSGSGATAFQFVAEIDLSVTSYTDSVTSAGLGENLETLYYEEPPANLQGLVSHPNGFLVGFVGSDLYFSEVNRPHAWPSSYALRLTDQIVGLGVFGQSIAVMTKGNPYIASGVSPESMSSERIPMIEPCVSKRSITADMMGVSYASPNGLVMIGAGTTGPITTNVMLRNEFQKFHPETMRSAFYAGKYFGFFDGVSYGIDGGAIVLDRNISATPLTLTNYVASATHVDPDTADLYLVINNSIQKWEGDDLSAIPYEWKSKRFQLTAPVNLAAIEIEADFTNADDLARLEAQAQLVRDANAVIYLANPNLDGALATTALNVHEVNGSLLEPVPSFNDDRYILVSIYCDDRLIYTGQYTSRGVYRLPSGFKGQGFEIKIAGNIELRHVKIAESVKELKSL